MGDNKPSPPNVSGATIQFVRDKPLLHHSSRCTSNENFLAASQSPIQLPGNRLDTKISLAKQPITRCPLPKLKPRKPAFNAKVGVLYTPPMIGAPERRRIPQQTKFNPKPRRHLFHHVKKMNRLSHRRAAQARTRRRSATTGD